MSRECLLCEGPFLDGSQVAVVKRKGLQSFIEASKKRNDRKVVLLKNFTELEVHEKCRKQYTKEKSIAAYIKRIKESGTKPLLRSQIFKFSFRTHCFLCGEEVPSDYGTKQLKKPANKRNPVYPVRKLSVAENVLRLAKDRNDEYGRAIIDRVQSVSDLPASDAQYHFSCMKSLYQPQLSGKPFVGRPKDDLEGALEEQITEAGERFLVALYNGDHRSTTLNKLRYKKYLTLAYKVSGSIATLPPTEAAAQQHSFRVYCQMQQ
uniref:Uncharacterized protein n=1 Tax=Clastoptera arizonana TaxID=38151 RepID=A0A1B6DZA6_9HEMI